MGELIIAAAMRAFMVHTGDALTILRTMPDESVHCSVTSPPFYGLRDYGTAKWEGGDSACSHFKLAGGTDAQKLGKSVSASIANVERSSVSYRDVCGQCGARRVDQQIGLEETHLLYVERLVEVFREVRRVLRKDGTCWLNLGDSYASQGGSEPAQTKWHVDGASATQNGGASRKVTGGLKPKDLMGIPWRVAFALQDDGWWLRSDIIWSKPAPMPESVKDRCTRSHEYVFMLTKAERYWYDAAAIAESAISAGEDRGGGIKYSTNMLFLCSPKMQHLSNIGSAGETRNKRTVWTLGPQPTTDSHFATYPIELPETCILAGCPEGGTVLDPFSGAGTTGLACLKHGRKYIGIELNPEYVELGYSRVRRHYPLLLGGAPAASATDEPEEPPWAN